MARAPARRLRRSLLSGVASFPAHVAHLLRFTIGNASDRAFLRAALTDPLDVVAAFSELMSANSASRHSQPRRRQHRRCRFAPTRLLHADTGRVGLWQEQGEAKF